MFRRSVGRTTLWLLFLPAAALGLLYWPVVRGLAIDWWEKPVYHYGFFVPLASAFLLVRSRRNWSRLAVEPSNGGLLILAAALGLAASGAFGGDLLLSRVSLVAALAGLIVFLAGWRMLRAVGYPVALLMAMIPWPDVVYHEIMAPLETLAVLMARGFLDILGVPTLRGGDVLLMPDYTLKIGMAEGGVAYLAALMTGASVFAYWRRFGWRAHVALAAAAVPFAVACSALRVTMASLLAEYAAPEQADWFVRTSGNGVFLAGCCAVAAAAYLLLGPAWRAGGAVNA